MATFPSIRIEGGLLGPDILDQLLAGKLPGQKPSDFGVDAKRSLTDEIAYVFADVRSQWEIFQHRLEKLPKRDLATSATRDAWMIPFLGLLGYEPKYNPRAYSVDGVSLAISHRAGEPEDSPPIHIVGAGQDLGRVPVSGKPRMAPHSLLQEYLNRTEALWGLVTNGSTLRLLRDTTFVRRQAYVEFDLQALIEEKRFEDFSALYRLIHRSRLPQGERDAGDCLLEEYYEHSEVQGGRIRDDLRDGVKECITLLANGFLSHPANKELRRRVASTTMGNECISADQLYRQLLRLIYRLLFLLVSEDRGLLGAEPLYRDHYGIARLRNLVDLRAAYTHHDDIWRSLRVLWRVLSDDKPQSSLQGQPMASVLGLPLLNGELFAPVILDSFTIANDGLLQALGWLAWYEDRDSRAIRRVNYAALDVEELGSVYESLLEFHPHISEVGSGFTFELLEEGQERRSTGSHYTPPELVVPLIKYALEPVLTERLSNTKTSADKERAILSMKVADLACGSGHFLLAAARRLGKELASVRTDSDEPPPEAVREAIREVVTHCIYGVDKNPLAVELCRVALWLESHAAGKPLTFLDHRIRCGDSLVGVSNLDVLEHGIPDEAFKPVKADDRSVARELRKVNANQRGAPLFQAPYADELRQLSASIRNLEELPEDTIEHVRVKAEAYRRVEHRREFERFRLASDVWAAAFFQEFQKSRPYLVTDVLRSVLTRGSISDARLAGFVGQTSVANGFIHLPVAFPEVFGRGGFDVILGNPPFMGGLRITEQFGDRYRSWLEKTVAGFKGKADLCAVFFRKAFDLLRPGGRFGLVATNTVSQGDSREAGLACIVREGGHIVFGQRFLEWPGAANVEVNLVSVAKGETADLAVLDGAIVETISSRLDASPEHELRRLPENLHKSFQGSIVLGKGFILTIEESGHLIGKNPRNAECLFPYLTGEDLNNDPRQCPSRWVIQFGERNESEAKKYEDLWKVVQSRVWPERRDKDVRKYPRMVNEWWKHWNNRQELYRTVRPLNRVLARSRVSEMHMLAFVQTNWIYADVVVVFAFDDDYSFAVLQSNIHEQWTRWNASTMRTDIRYTPTDCFETFPFPIGASADKRTFAARIGARYLNLRAELLLANGIGLTSLYNRFHNPACSDPRVKQLRELHEQLDSAVLDCYDWSDLTLDHDFYRNERGHVRFGVSSTAKREILARLFINNQSLT